MKSSSNLLKKVGNIALIFVVGFLGGILGTFLTLKTSHSSTSNTESKQVHSTTVKTAYKNTTSTSEAVDKVKKHDGEMNIALERTDDILAWVGAHKPEKLFVCGFSMETRDLIENSTAKLHKKNMDMIVANNLKVPGAGFGVDTNVVTIITAQGVTELPLQSKDAVAGHIADAIAGK